MICFHGNFLYLLSFSHKINLRPCACLCLTAGDVSWNQEIVCTMLAMVSTTCYLRKLLRGGNSGLFLIPQANYFYSTMLPPMSGYLGYKLS